MTALAAYHGMLVICAIGVAIDACEQLVRAHQLADGGLYGWRVLRRRYDRLPAGLRRLADAACAGQRRPMWVLGVRLVAAVGLIGAIAVPAGSPAFAAALTALLATQLYHFARRAGFGIVGADQMNLIILAAAWLGIVVDGTPGGLRAGLWFVAAQSCLAYGVNGGTKLASASWRSGRALPAVFSTWSNGHPALHAALVARPRLARALCWLTMLWECSFPLVLVAGEPVRTALVISGAVFHVSVALAMGIHLFVWAFIAPYAAIYAVT